MDRTEILKKLVEIERERKSIVENVAEEEQKLLEQAQAEMDSLWEKKKQEFEEEAKQIIEASHQEAERLIQESQTKMEEWSKRVRKSYQNKVESMVEKGFKVLFTQGQ